MGEPGRPFESFSLTVWCAFVLIEDSVVGLPRSRRRAYGPAGVSVFPGRGALPKTQTLKARVGSPPARAVCAA